MATNKPANISSKIWAALGDVETPTDVKMETGWVAEVPKAQVENWVQNRQDAFNAHVNERGIAEWDATTDYIANKSYVQDSSGTVYRAVQNTGPSTVVQNPTTDGTNTYWTVAFAGGSLDVYTKGQADARFVKNSELPEASAIPWRLDELEQFDEDLADAIDPEKGASLVARSSVTVESVLALLSAKQDTTQLVITQAFHPGWAAYLDTPVGGGEFVWRADKPKSAHNGGTIISPTVPWDGTQAGLAGFLAGDGETSPGSSGCWVRRCGTQFDPTWFGARANKTVNYAQDDTASFRACIAAVYALGARGGSIAMPTCAYVITGQLEIVVSKISIDFNRSYLYCRDAPPETKILYVTGDLDGYKQDGQSVSELKNFVLVGNYAGTMAETYTVDAMVFDQPLLSDPSGPSFLRVSGAFIEAFRTGVKVLNNSYLIRFDSVQIGGCINGAWGVSGTTNSGEAVTFRNCNFQASKTDLRLESNSSDWYVYTSSFDFTNGTWLDVSNKARIDLSGCHFEQKDYSDYLFKVASQGTIHITGGMVYVQAGASQHTHLIRNEVVADTDGGITFDGTWFYGVSPTYNALSAGVGRTILRNTRGVDFAYLTSRNARSNLLPDGGFEASDVRGLVSIGYDTAITDQWTGGNISLETSTTQARSGSRSLRVSKTTAVIDRSFFIAVPVRSERVHSVFWIKPGTYTGNVLVEYGFANVKQGTNKLDVDYFTRDASYTARTIDLSVSSDWREFFGMTRPTPSPAWATHHVIRFVIQSAGTGDFFIDDFGINTL